MTPLDILRGARELLAKPEAWTKGRLATNAAGFDVSPAAHDAVCFCIVGAAQRIAENTELLLEALDALRGLTGVRLLGYQFNDRRATTHADVLALLDKGIAQLEGM